MLSAVDAVLSLPTVSVNVAASTEMLPVPESVFDVGVNTAEYTVEDVVVSAPMLPPETVMSPTAKVEDASERVKVLVEV